jgi:hypothetical protein
MTGCSQTDSVVPILSPLDENPPHDTWVATDPIQCLGNPWEQDWLESHNWDHASYPGDPLTPGLDPMEMEIITDYYERQGVKILAGETVQQEDDVCLSCACPLGYTLYLLVPGEHVVTMLNLGFRLEMP